MRHYDLCVIGSGPAGQKAAIQASKLGKSVCVIEKMRSMGGVAINTGTIPSKALREAVLTLLGDGRDSASAGRFAKLDRETQLAGLIGYCERVIAKEVELVGRHFHGNGVEMLHGAASFSDANSVHVEGERVSERVTFENALVAVGTVPARPTNIPFDGQNVLTSDEIPKLSYLPRSMIVVGGGVIGTEYASMLARLGVRVTLVEGRPRILDFVDSEIGEALQYHLRHSGMTLRLGENVTCVETVEPPPGARCENQTMVEATLESGKTLRADCLLYCVGRQGATAELSLNAAGLEADRRGRIAVNEHFQTSTEHIYACGDVIGFPALASTSMEQGRLAACHMYGQPSAAVPDLLPYGIYAIPEISMVGWNEERLTKDGIPYESGIAQYREIARGQLIGDDTGMLKLLIHQDSHVLLGVHVIGTGATELVHIGQAVMSFNGTAEYFVQAVFNYPTLAECYKVAALNGLNKIRSV